MMFGPDVTAPGIIALCAVFTVLTISLTVARFVLRRHQQAPYLADDWLILFSTVLFIATTVLVYVLVSIQEVGYASSQVSEEQQMSTAKESAELKIPWLVLTIAAQGGTKGSALWFYHRIFSAPGTTVFRTIVACSLFIVASWTVTFAFLAIFDCHTHFDALWNEKLFNKYCTLTYPFQYGWVISDVLLDAWVITLPIPMVLRLQTTWQRKCCILAAFCIALAGLGASLARMAVVIKIETMGEAEIEHTDVEHADTQGIYYAMLEVGMSILAINMTSLWPVVAKFNPEYALRSFRSRFALSSNRSDASRSRNSNEPKTFDDPSEPSHSCYDRTSKDSGLGFHSNASGTCTRATRDLERLELPDFASDRILVRDSVEVLYEKTSALEN